MINLRVTNREYRTQFNNDSNFLAKPTDYTSNLVGLVMDTIQAIITLELSWDSSSSISLPWTITARAVGFEISGGEFIEDGWSVGNTFDYYEGGVLIDTGTVTFISDDGSYMFVTCPLMTTGSKTDSQIRARADSAANQMTSLIYTPNLIENGSQFTTLSLLTNRECSYFTTNLRNPGGIAMEPYGVNRSTLTGTAYVEHISDVDYVQTYEITETFIIQPFWRFGDDFITQPEYLQGTNSLKHVFRADFRLTLSNPNSRKVAESSGSLGSVGYFNETLSGGEPDYAVESIAGQMTIEEVNTYTVTLSGSFDVNSKFTVFIAKLNDYINNNPFVDNFYFNYNSNFLGVSSSFPGQIIKAISSSLVSGDAVLTIEIDVTAIPSEEYMLAVAVGNTSLDNSVSDRVCFVIERGNFISVSGNNDLILPVDMSYTSYATTNDILYNEDGVYVDFSFDADLSKQTSIQTVEFQLVSTDGNTAIILDSFPIVTSPPAFISGVQQINVNLTRGYLMQDSTFNSVAMTTGGLAGDLQRYSGRVAQKVSWQDWILNNTVPDLFFDNSKPQGNRNFKTSNYDEFGYSPQFRIKVTARGEDIFGNITLQEYYQSLPVDVLDYLEDTVSPARITPIIQLFDTNGNEITGIMSTEPTEFRITWDADTPIGTTGGVTIIHRLERFEQRGYSIFEITNALVNTNDSRNPLYDLSLSIVDGNLVSSCMIDNTKLREGNYSLSGRVTLL